MRFEVSGREVRLANGQRAVVVDVAGELDVHTAPRLKERLQRLERGGTHAILVNLAQVTFIDSIGLGVLIGGLNRARAAGGSLVLASPHPRIQRILNLTRLSSAFAVVNSEAEGLDILTNECGETASAPDPEPEPTPAPHADVVELTIPGRPENVGVARLVIAGIASGIGFSYDEVEDIKLAVGEACTVALNAATPGGPPPPVALRCQVEPTALVIDAMAPPGVNGTLPDPVDDESSISRLLIESLMDRVEVPPDTAPGICMRMIKSRPRTS